MSLDADVAAQLDRLQKERNSSFKETVNEALRLGLKSMATPAPKRKKFRTKSVNTGRCLLPNVDNIGEVLAHLEGENYK